MKVIFEILLPCALLSLNVYEILGEKELEVNVNNGPDLKEAIEKFIKDFQSSIPEVFTFVDRNLTLPNNKYVTGTVNFSNMSCTGLKEFNATVIYRNFLPVPKAYILTLEDIALNLDYNSNLTIYNSKYLSLFGEGSASLSLKNLIFDGNLTISLLPINASTTTDIDLENVLVNVTGLLDDDNFSTDFGKFLGKTITVLFAEYKNAIAKTLTEILNFILQDVLHHRQNFSGNKEFALKADDLLHILQDAFFDLTSDK